MTEIISQQFQKINELLKEAQNVLITAHENPDADAVGSVLTMSYALNKSRKGSFGFPRGEQNFQIYHYLPDEIPQYLNFLPGIENLKKEIPSFDFDLLFCLDYGDFERLKLPQNFSEEKIITLDHHLESDQKGRVKIVSSEFSSTAEIIYLWLVESGIEIDKEMATCLLAGIISDTGGFKHISTSPRVLEITANLISLGVPLEAISRQILTLGKTLAVSKIWAEALSRVNLDLKKNLAFSWVSFEDLKKYQASPSDLNGISGLISTISGAAFSFFLIEYEKGKIKGSLRSEPYKGEKINEMAKALGGNGHSYAAGFKQEGTIEEVIKRVYNLIS